ncbi:MAG: Lrp/AsnC family transcriptional regulator [Candidatus Odinarchaeota archaeon]|nr:Lrp/AsnC family transcriptional regulator [Candidatus Odinarchaeota archaeon]
MKQKIDPLTRKILKILFKNSRTSYVDIAKETGIPFSTVRYKVQNLMNSNFIKRFTVVVNPDKLGIISGIILIKTNGQTKEVSEFCQKIPNSSIIAYTMGYYDLIMELVAKDMKELKRIVEEIKNQESVLQVDVNIVLNWEKWEFPAEFI